MMDITNSLFGLQHATIWDLQLQLASENFGMTEIHQDTPGQLIGSDSWPSLFSKLLALRLDIQAMRLFLSQHHDDLFEG